MDPTVTINERVDLVMVSYAREREIVMFRPIRMRYHRQDIELELLMRHPTIQGKRMIHVFDVTDGTNDYRLEFDAERLICVLVSMIGGDHV